MDLDLIERVIYDEDLKKSIDFAKNCKDSTSLHVFIYNYNYQDGFEIPNLVIENSCCTLSTALSIFYNCEGYDYLLEKPKKSELKEWFKFIRNLYNNIVNNKYSNGDIHFSPPLTKVQAYKLKKELEEQEYIFLSQIEGIDYDIEL